MSPYFQLKQRNLRGSRFDVERDLRVVGVLCATARLSVELAFGEEPVHDAENADERARVRERLGDADGDRGLDVLVEQVSKVMETSWGS